MEKTEGKEEVDQHNDPIWESKWEKGIAPGESFDKSNPSPLLIKYLHEGLIPNGRALVPGCGRGYDVTALASDERYVLGLDISRTAVEKAKERAKSLPASECLNKSKIEFQTTSFFDLKPANDSEKFHFIYDYTFLCALHPSTRTDWALQMSELILKDGILLTLIFPINSTRKVGPPYEVTLENYKELLEAVGFECLELSMVPKELCHSERDGSETALGATGVGRWRKL
jgi:SAM-dependent methyltransferase